MKSKTQIKKVRELSVDLNKEISEFTGRVKGFDFYVDAKENPSKLKEWVIQILKENNVDFLTLTISRPQKIDSWMKVHTRNNIENYIKVNLKCI